MSTHSPFYTSISTRGRDRSPEYFFILPFLPELQRCKFYQRFIGESESLSKVKEKLLSCSDKNFKFVQQNTTNYFPPFKHI